MVGDGTPSILVSFVGDTLGARRRKALMHPTSPDQFEAWTSGRVPTLEQVRDDVWALGQPMPHGHLPYSLLYLLRDRDGALHVIDPGWNSPEGWDGLSAALAQLGAVPADVLSMTSTHLHPDHIGLSERLREASGAPLQIHEAESAAEGSPFHTPRETGEVTRLLADWGVPEERRGAIVSMTTQASEFVPPRADRTLVDGERLDVPGFDLIAMHTPGHTSGHLSLRDDSRSILFTGDHLLPMMHAGLGLGARTDSNPLADYLASLRRVSGYPDHEVLPGHGYRFRGVAERATQSAEHHLSRSREVAAVLAEDAASTNWQIAERLTWTAGWDGLDGFFLYSALAQTAMHREYVERVPVVGPERAGPNS
jgi:glyoxylase-like metal-dependent hydrolase (beta-lactamase superfamily II)